MGVDNVGVAVSPVPGADPDQAHVRVASTEAVEHVGNRAIGEQAIRTKSACGAARCITPLERGLAGDPRGPPFHPALRNQQQLGL